MSDIRKAVKDMTDQLSSDKWEGATEPFYDYDTSGLAHEITSVLIDRYEALQVIREIANIAHHGGLIGYTTSAKAMDAIRDLSRSWWDKKECDRLQKHRANVTPNAAWGGIP